MLREKRGWMTMMLVILISLAATPAFARGISFKDAGVALWIFIIIGAVIVLLQLIPAAILFFSFIGTTSATVFKGKKVSGQARAEEKEKLVLPGYEPTPVEK